MAGSGAHGQFSFSACLIRALAVRRTPSASSSAHWLPNRPREAAQPLTTSLGLSTSVIQVDSLTC